ncbi:MAG: TIM44-like domain-containing protein [Bacilli bacterium]|nr:TIM44-like domain-containing protein [Bacilli bacterium]
MLNELIRLDNTFSESKFKTKVDNIFVMLHISLMTNNLDRVKHFISNKVFNNFNERLNNLNNNNQIQMFDELNVKSTEIQNIEITNDNFIITVKLTSRYMDYVINKDTKKLISGNNSHRIEKTNILTFTKIRDFKIQDSVRKCPSCSANMNVNNTGKCEYCGTIYNNKDYDWILENIETK